MSIHHPAARQAPAGKLRPELDSRVYIPVVASERRRVERFEPRRVDHAACVYVLPETGKPCGAPVAAASHDCPSCQKRRRGYSGSRYSITSPRTLIA